jgi:hypothetical protein
VKTYINLKTLKKGGMGFVLNNFSILENYKVYVWKVTKTNTVINEIDLITYIFWEVINYTFWKDTKTNTVINEIYLITYN